MLNVEHSILEKYPRFADKPRLLQKTTFSVLKKITHEASINRFLDGNAHLKGLAFVDAVLNYFDFDYQVKTEELRKIPVTGRLLIVANHPIGSLDGLALLRMVSKIRPDVRVVANDMLMHFQALHEVFIPLDNLSRGAKTRGVQAYKNVISALHQEQAVIVFPAGEVSRIRPTGIKDSAWRSGFLRFARKASAPILPIHIKAKNSWLFYSASFLFKPLGTALLAHEMFNQKSNTIHFSIGNSIDHQQLNSDHVQDKVIVKRLRKHLYELGSSKKTTFQTEKPIAQAESPEEIRSELFKSVRLGKTRDNNVIFLFDAFENSVTLRELGRLREIAFRAVGEGSGSARDLDSYDLWYRHLVLWDDSAKVIAGAYRIGEGEKLLQTFGEQAFYTRSLYLYKASFLPVVSQSIELGRSFVNPEYWGKASLDYLWQGLGAYLKHNPSVRYLIGAVSMSNHYNQTLQGALVYFFQRYHACPENHVAARHPYVLGAQALADFDALFEHCDRDQAFVTLQNFFEQHEQKVPVLFKQYLAAYETGGFQSLVFSFDPNFSDCLDGMCIGDLSMLTASKRKRYLGEVRTGVNSGGD